MNGLCPRCKQPLQSVQAGQFSLGACHSCAGFFATNDVCQHIATKLDDELLALAHQSQQGRPDLSSMPDGTEPLACPSCGDALRRVDIAGTSLDVCNAHGTWFDAFELERVMRAKNMPIARPSLTGSQIERAPLPTENRYVAGAEVIAADVSDGLAQTVAVVAAEAVADGAATLAFEGLFAVIGAIFD